MTEVKEFYYTKDNGERSYRRTIDMAVPRVNYLCFDVTDLTPDETDEILNTLAEIDDFRAKTLEKVADLIKWRSFKPERISTVNSNAA